MIVETRERRSDPKRSRWWLRGCFGLLLALLFAVAGSVHARTIKIATWNLEWLTLRPQGDPALPNGVAPKTADAITRLRDYAIKLDADVVAFQEVDGAGMAARIFLPGRYQIVMGNGTEIQRVGFAIRNNINFTRNPDLYALNLGNQGLRGGTDITIALDHSQLRLLAVHLKSGCSNTKLSRSDETTACAELHRQIPLLQNWIADRATANDAFLLLGDFNRRMNDQDQMWKALQRKAPLTLTDEGQDSPCWGGGSFIDHLITGGPARDWLVPGSLRVLVYREQGDAEKALLSDHCPVSAKFELN